MRAMTLLRKASVTLVLVGATLNLLPSGSAALAACTTLDCGALGAACQAAPDPASFSCSFGRQSATCVVNEVFCLVPPCNDDLFNQECRRQGGVVRRSNVRGTITSVCLCA